jgi:D-3-phosphoglycerate dehydrogenase
MAGQMAKEAVAKIEVGTFGRLGAEDTRELGYSALKGLLTRGSDVPVTLVNAPSIAEQRGVQLVQTKSATAHDYASLLTVSVGGTKTVHTLAGTCFEGQETGRIVRIDDFEIDLNPAKVMLLMFYPDRPGMIGKLGTILGEADINIAHMAVGRREKRGQAVVALTLDDSIPDEVLKKIGAAIHVDELCHIQLP